MMENWEERSKAWEKANPPPPLKEGKGYGGKFRGVDQDIDFINCNC
jgi:hypothetical protein